MRQAILEPSPESFVHFYASVTLLAFIYWKSLLPA